MRVHLCGVRGSTPAPGAEFVRYGGHTSCLALCHDESPRPTLILDAGTGLRQVTALLGGRPFAGTILLTHLHWDHVQGLPFFRGGDRDDARVALLLPDQEQAGDGADREAVLARAMSPPHFPIGPDGPARRLDVRAGRAGKLQAEGFSVLAREIPHKGGRTFGYRVSDGRSSSPTCPTTARPASARDRRAGASTTRPRSSWRTAPTCSSTTASCWPRGGRRGVVRPRGRRVRGRPGPRAGARAVALFHHGPTAPTPNWTSWRPRSPADLAAASPGARWRPSGGIPGL